MQIVRHYSLRWIIEQFFRTLKKKGFAVEETQLQAATTVVKQITMAMKAACTVLQLIDARRGQQPIHEVFTEREQQVLQQVNKQMEAPSEKKNPFLANQWSYATWMIARLGGWKGYESQRPPRPMTIKRGLKKFYAFVEFAQIMDSS